MIMDGTKILSIIVDKLQFLDSLNFLPTSLKNMHKSFESARKKCYYPHLLIRFSNFVYVGPYPAPKFYRAEYMSGDEQAQFLEWYEKQTETIFCNNRRFRPTEWTMTMF